SRNELSSSAPTVKTLPLGIRYEMGYSVSCTCGADTADSSVQVVLDGSYTSGVSAQWLELVSLPLIATYRPSASSVTVGYQRGRCMSATRGHGLVAGSKMLVSARPRFPVVGTPKPPATSSRPSGRVA